MEVVLQFFSFSHCHFLHASPATPLPSFLSPPLPGGPFVSTDNLGSLLCSALFSRDLHIHADGMSCTPSSEVLDHCPSLCFSSVKCLPPTAPLWTLLFTTIVLSQKKNFISAICSSTLSFFISVFFSHLKTLHYGF